MEYKIIEAHWSTDPSDSHQPDDADCTYAVLDPYGKLVNIFLKRFDAEQAVPSFV